MSTFGLTLNLKSPDRNKQFISNIHRTFGIASYNNPKLFHYPRKWMQCFLDGLISRMMKVKATSASIFFFFFFFFFFFRFILTTDK